MFDLRRSCQPYHRHWFWKAPTTSAVNRPPIAWMAITDQVKALKPSKKVAIKALDDPLLAKKLYAIVERRLNKASWIFLIHRDGVAGS